MQIETTQTAKQVIDFPIPSFWKDGGAFGVNLLGFPDEETCISLYYSESRVNVANTELKHCHNDAAKAFAQWEQITEEVFLTAHEKALSRLSLAPVLIEK